MEKVYEIIYQEEVSDNDLPMLDSFWRTKILTLVREKLSHNPEMFGKPLRYALKSHRTLRVGNFRVVFRIENNKVIIILIDHRKDIYEEALKRIKKYS